MDLIGLLDNIISGTASIDSGRKGFATDGEETEKGLNLISNPAKKKRGPHRSPPHQ
jgi:hypothetical protein